MKTLVRHTYSVYNMAVKCCARDIHNNDETEISPTHSGKYLIHFLPSHLPQFTEHVQTETCAQEWFNNSISNTISHVFDAITQVLICFCF